MFNEGSFALKLIGFESINMSLKLYNLGLEDLDYLYD